MIIVVGPKPELTAESYDGRGHDEKFAAQSFGETQPNCEAINLKYRG